MQGKKMSNAITVQLHAAEKFDTWIIQDRPMQMSIWKKAYERLGTEFAHGCSDFQATLEIQSNNDKADLAWAMFALSVLTAGTGTLISAALAEASLVTKLASSTGQTAAVELVKEKMGSGAKDAADVPGPIPSICRECLWRQVTSRCTDLTANGTCCWIGAGVLSAN